MSKFIHHARRISRGIRHGLGIGRRLHRAINGVAKKRLHFKKGQKRGFRNVYDAKTRKRLRNKRQVEDIQSGAISTQGEVMTVKEYTKSKTLATFEYVQQNYDEFHPGLGQQGVKMVAAHNTLSQLIVSSGSGPGYDQFNAAAFDLNPNQTNTGSGVFGTVTRPLQDRIICKHLTVDFQFSNASNAPCVVILYWLLSLKPQPTAPDSTWINLLTQRAMGIGSAGNASQSGGTITPGTAGAATYNLYGESPTSLPEFRKNYRILCERSYPMPSGHVQHVPYRVNFNKMYDKALASQYSAAGNVAYPGGTVYLMALVRGSPVQTQKSDGTDVAITTSNNTILFTSVSRYSYSTPTSRPNDINRVMPSFVGSVTGGDKGVVETLNTFVSATLQNI